MDCCGQAQAETPMNHKKYHAWSFHERTLWGLDRDTAISLIEGSFDGLGYDRNSFRRSAFRMIALSDPGVASIDWFSRARRWR